VDFFLVFWNAFYQNQPRKVSLKALTKQVELATEENVDFLRARSLRALAEFYWKIEKNYELAFEQYLLLDKELASAEANDYPEMTRDLMQIGQAYYFFQDYPMASKYFKRAIAVPETPFNTMVINDARNTLGLCYQQFSDLDSSDYYFKEVLKTSFPESAVWKRIATGNLGANMYLRKQYDNAVPLLETDFYGAVAENDYGCAAGASILLADIFRDKGKMEQAATFIAHARDNIKKAEQPDRLRFLYPVMNKWYAAAGDIERSMQYADSSVSAFNRYRERFSALKVLRAQQRVDRQKEELQLAAFTLETQQKTAERNLLHKLTTSRTLGVVYSTFE
jgi:tetratricopeptide (TPR) repeat protein